MHSGPYSVAKQQWEKSDFPVVCQRCLGDNPYQRMMKQPFAAECKMCARPFSVFRWKPNRKGAYAKTTICLTCSKGKNLCQACVLDLVYGMPAHLRDRIQPELASRPEAQSGASREYFADLAERELAQGNVRDFNKAPPKPRMLGIAAVANPLAPGDQVHAADQDVTNCTLWVGGLQPVPSKQELEDALSPYGTLAEVRVLAGKCAFAEFEEREAALRALAGGLRVAGQTANLGWAKQGGRKKTSASRKPIQPPPGIKPPPGVAYPSMVDMQEGSRLAPAKPAPE